LTGTSAEASKGTVRAWDIPTRLFHWTLAALVLSAWASWRYSEALDDPTLSYHRWIGHAVLVLIAFRLLWGFFGSSTSRFTAWLYWPWTAGVYLLALLQGRSSRYLGHTPIGSYMILALLAATTTQAIMGLLAVEHNDITAGPLYRLLSEDHQELITSWHRWFFYWVLLPLICVHVLANLLYGLIKKDPLITGMITGKKPAGRYADSPEARIATRSLLRALVCVATAAAFVFALILALGGKYI
jgi:cytochrome b